MRKIGVVTTNRSDYGLYRPILDRLKKEARLEFSLFVSGAHLSKKHGNTIAEIQADRRPIADKIKINLTDDSPKGVAIALAQAVAGFARSFDRRKPDLLLLLGDRFEMFAAAAAATPLVIPIAHIHGGEVTEGAIDNAFRHAITKMSHLHFTANKVYADRLRRMGEEDWRITVSGAPGLDNVAAVDYLTSDIFEKKYGIDARSALLVTFHPVTLEAGAVESQFKTLLAALDSSSLPCLFTAPNNDTNGLQIMKLIELFLKTHRQSKFVKHFGTQGYFSAMKWAAAMVGNSSSGLIEAPSFKLPVVNIGNRQKGRLRAANVIDCGNDKQSIVAAIKKATSKDFRDSLKNLKNPYGDGKAADVIVRRLASVAIDQTLLMKKFSDGKETQIITEALV